MRTIAHLSDLHFGRLDHALLDPLKRCLERLQPHVLVVSGDLTQRAKPHEFREARRWLDTLPKPQIVVPGNHDVPLYNVFQRFFTPLSKFRRFISPEEQPAYVDGEIAVLGLNTARSLVFKGGRVNEEQVERIRSVMCALDERIIKMIVSHHPFDLPDDWDADDVVGRAKMALKTLAQCGVDVLLAGHVHTSHAGHTTLRCDVTDFSALVVQAGTATSTRGRGEANSFNAVVTDDRHVRVDRYSWDEAAADFVIAETERFERMDKRWIRG
jgi:3',5'-cyclic AMP phosphodiesterase CpdA